MEKDTLLDLQEQPSSPHEAQTMAELIMPNQLEEIKELCGALKTKPQIEASAMFGDEVNFYKLHRNSAKALAMKLRYCLESQI